jgi:hypothetical protein
MVAFDSWNDRQREEIVECITDEAWGAIKDWQSADPDGRPQIDHTTVAYAVETFMGAARRQHPDGGQLVTEGVAAVLTALNREGAAIYWENRP